MSGFKEIPPIKGRAVYFVSEQDRAQGAIRVIGCLAYLVRRLQVNLFHRVIRVRWFLVPVKSGAGFDRCC